MKSRGAGMSSLPGSTGARGGLASSSRRRVVVFGQDDAFKQCLGRKSVLRQAERRDRSPPDASEIAETAFPAYLQSYQAFEDCSVLEDAMRDAILRQEPGEEDMVWRAIRQEAERDAAAEPLLSSFLYGSILCHDSFERALAFVLSNRLADVTLLSTELFEMFFGVLRENKSISEAARADVVAAVERDPACRAYSQCLLYSKGFHAVQTHRISHELWNKGSKFMALALQSRISEVFAVDIHPAARIGKGLLLDHATGVVIGETAVIGDFCSILQGVTLGGTGKDHGDRHPKVREGVLIGAYATILGNIEIGAGAQVAAGSLVLRPVEPHDMVAGSPAAVVGKVRGKPALKMEHWKKGLEQCVFGEKQCDFVDDVVAATEKKREMVVDMTASEEGGPAVI